MKHTPGPWVVNGIRTVLGRLSHGGALGGAIGDLVADVHGRSSQELDANVRLIAGAPLLLSALIEAAGGIESALSALENDRLAGRYVRARKRQSVNDQSMNAELAEVAMAEEKEARSALTAARAAIAKAEGSGAL